MSLQRRLQSLCWLAFLAVVVLGGHATTYIAAWQLGLVLATVLLLAVATAFGWWLGNDCGHGHEHHDHQPTSWHETAVHALPLMLFLAIGPTSLGSQSLPSAGPANGIGPTPPIISQPGTAPTAGYFITDLMSLRADPFLAGGPIEIIARLGKITERTGRKHSDGTIPTAEHWVIYRHMMSCCAADARPVSAYLAVPPPTDLPIDSWVRVRGLVDRRDAPGLTPTITVDSIRIVPAPRDPYLTIAGGPVKTHR